MPTFEVAPTLPDPDAMLKAPPPIEAESDRVLLPLLHIVVPLAGVKVGEFCVYVSVAEVPGQAGANVEDAPLELHPVPSSTMIILLVVL